MTATKPVKGSDLTTAHTLVGEDGGLSAIHDIDASAAMPGLLRVETEHGALYLDPDEEHLVVGDSVRVRRPHPVWEPESGPAADALVFGLIEWGEDTAHEPTVLMGSRAAVEMRLVWEIEEQIGHDGEWFADAPGFLDDHPYPGDGPVQAFHDWLCALHEATTVPWVTLYTVSDDAGVLRSGNPGVPIFQEDA